MHTEQAKQQGLHAHSMYKRFGETRVLENVNLTIEPGSCYGLLGNNGAGKSTLINIIVDLVQPEHGEVTLFGHSMHRNPLKLKPRIGVLPEQDLLNGELSAREQLRFSGLIYGLDDETIRERSETLFEYFFENQGDLDRRCGGFSSGMRKKLGVIASVLHKPDLLILDEPFSGLDPASSRAVINFIDTYLNRDRIVLLSSHNLSYVEQIATHIGVLHQQQLLFSGPLSEFTRNGKHVVEQSLFDMLGSETGNTDGLKKIFT